MSGVAANQHIELDGSVLSAHATTLTRTSETFASASAAVDAPLAAEAFGILAQGILVPAATALAGRARELLAAAGDLSGRVATATEAGLTAFSTIEEEAVAAFTGVEE